MNAALTVALLSSVLFSAAPGSPGSDVPETAGTGVRIGVPGGAALDAFVHPARREVYVFVRFAEPRAGELTFEVLNDEGEVVARRQAVLSAGSAMLLWDGVDDGGSRVPAGEYTVVAATDGPDLLAPLTLP